MSITFAPTRLYIDTLEAIYAKLTVESQNNQPKSFDSLTPQLRIMTFFLGLGCVQCSITLWLCVSGVIILNIEQSNYFCKTIFLFFTCSPLINLSR
jgi:hypothetical protein